jgi:hypothetical protein
MRHIPFFIFLLIGNVMVAQQSNYFQQKVDYSIEVTLNDKEHSLSAFETFNYTNQSPDILDKLYIHLWPNAYKNAKTAMSKQKFRQGDFFMLWAKPTAKGYIDSLDFKVDGTQVKWEYFEGQEDIAVLALPKPLKPGETIRVSTPFYVKLPSGSISRLGHIDQSYQITQWYPKPAVYDKDGWHPIPYLTQGEFYSEFGSFDVKITLPDNYTVGATGNLQTQSEIERMDRLAGEKSSDKTMEFPPSSPNMKTLHYIQNNVHDFGWFADKRWMVRKGEVELPASKRKVTTWALYTQAEKALWEEEGIRSINDGLYYYSLWSGDYPYDVCTAVDGTISAGGGMEYPNVTVIGSSGNASQLRTVIIHEVGHNWFYGILGSNERDNAWMDEGINSFFETRTLMATRKDSTADLELELQVGSIDLANLLGIDNLTYSYLSEELPYLIAARTGEDQPIQAPSDDYTNLNYGGIVYKKTALAFNYLMAYLGEAEMNRCMAAYFEAWKFKHPSPSDLEAVFEETSGKNLDWFFDELIPTTHRVDYAVKSGKLKDGSYSIKVKNRGQIPAPFSLEVSRNGQSKSIVWTEGIQPGKSTRVRVTAEKGDLVKVNAMNGIPEYNRNDNTLRTEGIMRTVEPTTFKFLSSVDNPDHSQLFWIPLIGWNEYNKWMFGVNLHNRTVPRKTFQWSAAPMYSFVTGSLSGLGHIEYNTGRWGLGIQARRFGLSSIESEASAGVYNYDVVAPYAEAKLFTKRTRKDIVGNVRLTHFSVGQMVKNTNNTIFSDYRYVNQGYGNRSEQWRLEIDVTHKFPRNMIRFSNVMEFGEFTENTFLQQHIINHEWVYRGKGAKKIRTRLYAGVSNGFYLNLTGQYGNARPDQLSPENTLRNDYLYEGLFLGRDETSGFLSQQFMRTQGGLAAPTQQSANRFLLSANSEIDLPFKLPIGVYAGAAFLKNNRNVSANPPADGDFSEIIFPTDFSKRLEWNAGVCIRVIPNVVKVYLPIVYSQSIRDEVKTRSLNFAQTILFEFNINSMNPFKIAENVANR